MTFEAQQGRRTRLTDLVIPVTTDVSNMLNEAEYGGYSHLAILGLAGTYDGNMSLEANIDPALDETNDDQWKLYHPITPGTAVVPVADIMIVIPSPPTHGFRIKSSSSEDPAVTFQVWGIKIP